MTYRVNQSEKATNDKCAETCCRLITIVRDMRRIYRLRHAS